MFGIIFADIQVAAVFRNHINVVKDDAIKDDVTCCFFKRSVHNHGFVELTVIVLETLHELVGKLVMYVGYRG